MRSFFSPLRFIQTLVLVSAVGAAACSPPAPTDAGVDASSSADATTGTDASPQSDATMNDAGGGANEALGDLRAFPGATPRCTDETLRCIQACAAGDSQCETTCLANDLGGSTVLAGRPITCSVCLVRQRRVCAAENGCAREVRAFVACVNECGTDNACVSMNCNSLRGPLDACLQSAAGGMCTTTVTHPAVAACFGATPVADAGVTDASAPDSALPDAAAPDASARQEAIIDLTGTMVDGTPATYLVPVRLTQPVTFRSLSLSFGTAANELQNARIGELGLDGLQSIGVTTSAGVRSISVLYSGVAYMPPRVVAYARMAAMPTVSNVSTATDAFLNGTLIPVRIVGP